MTTDIVRSMLSAIGEDPERDGLKDTPARVVKSWKELYSGYGKDPGEILARQFELTDHYDQMVLLRDIEFFSVCEHHCLPFFGKAHVAYIPDKKRVVGLSKLARLVDCFARRLQIQERMTMQIGTAIKEHLEPRGIAVLLEAQHTCMVARGIQKQNGVMKTSFLDGLMKTDPSARAEFLSMLA